MCCIRTVTADCSDPTHCLHASKGVDLMHVFLLHALTETQLQMFYVYTLHKEIQSLHTILLLLLFRHSLY